MQESRERDSNPRHDTNLPSWPCSQGSWIQSLLPSSTWDTPSCTEFFFLREPPDKPAMLALGFLLLILQRLPGTNCDLVRARSMRVAPGGATAMRETLSDGTFGTLFIGEPKGKPEHRRCPFQVRLIIIEGAGLNGFYSIYQGHLCFQEATYVKPMSASLFDGSKPGEDTNPKPSARHVSSGFESTGSDRSCFPHLERTRKEAILEKPCRSPRR